MSKLRAWAKYAAEMSLSSPPLEVIDRHARVGFHGACALGPDAPWPASEEDLRWVASHGNVTFGPYTTTLPYLSMLPPAGRVGKVRRYWEWLAQSGLPIGS